MVWVWAREGVLGGVGGWEGGRVWGAGQGCPLWCVLERSSGCGYPQTGEPGPPLSRWGLELPQPLGQEVDGNTIVSQTDEGQTSPGPAPSYAGHHLATKDSGSFGVQTPTC